MTLLRLETPTYDINQFEKNDFVKYRGACNNIHYGVFTGHKDKEEIWIVNFELGRPIEIHRKISSGSVEKVRRSKAIDYFYSLADKFRKEFDKELGTISAFAARKQYNMIQILSEYEKTNDIYSAIMSKKQTPGTNIFVIEPRYSGYRLSEKPLESTIVKSIISEKTLEAILSSQLIHGFGNIPKTFKNHELLGYYTHEIPGKAINLVKPHKLEALERLGSFQYNNRKRIINSN